MFLETHVQLMRMLSFFCEGQVQTRSFSLQIASAESSVEEAALLWQTGEGPDAGDPGALTIPVRYSAIKDEFPGILEKWFENATRMRHVYDLFFAAMHRPGWFSDQDFLQLVQAIEVFSRITTDSSYLPVEQYELVRSALTNAIPAGIDASLREALKSRIKFGNGFSMRKRVTELLKNLDGETVELFTRDPRAFISRVVATRNYLVHLDETTKEDPFDDDELLAAILSLRLLLSVLLLKELGFTESRARDIISGSLLGSGLTLATLQPPPPPPPSPTPPPPAS